MALITKNVHVTEQELELILKNFAKKLPQFSSFDETKLQVSWEEESGVDIFVQEKIDLS